MSNWPSAKAKKVLAALQTIGWRVKRQSGSHKTLEHADYPDYVKGDHSAILFLWSLISPRPWLSCLRSDGP
jgi:predicted RNA binding protein YcfA (HicA-like mRNA interferase family)